MPKSTCVYSSMHILFLQKENEISAFGIVFISRSFFNNNEDIQLVMANIKFLFHLFFLDIRVRQAYKLAPEFIFNKKKNKSTPKIGEEKNTKKLIVNESTTMQNK